MRADDFLNEGAEQRKHNALWAQITDYEKRAKATKNDIKKNHLLKMADDLRAKLPTNEEKVRLDPKCWTGKKIGNPKTKMKGGVRVNNCVPAESVNEDADLRKLQQQWWVALPAIMKKAGIDYHPVKELSRDYYPTLGWITIPGERFTTFNVNANPKGDAAKINISVDVDTSNEFYRTAQPERAAKLNAVAEKIAQALGGTAAEHMTGQRRNHPGVSRITATMTLPKEPAEWQNPSRSYDPRARFLNTPGERARQGRAARSGFPDSYGGDASNYRLEGVAEDFNAEYDDEAGMAQGSLHTLKNAVEGLQQVIDSGDNLPEWCQEKISLAEDYLVTVWDYLQSEKAQGVDPELNEEFDLIENIIEGIAAQNGVDSEMVWTDLESLTEDELYAFAVTSQLNEDWQKANKRDKTDGMSQKAVNAYRREHPGSKLKTAVTTKPSKLKKGSKASKRRKSYCSRSRGQMKMHNISCAKTPDKAICKARRRWNC